MCVRRLYAQYGAGTAPGSQRALLTGRPLAQIVRHCQQMLQGVQWLHETAKLAHNDIKPANLLLTKEEVVKVCRHAHTHTHTHTHTQTNKHTRTHTHTGRSFMQPSIAVSSISICS